MNVTSATGRLADIELRASESPDAQTFRLEHKGRAGELLPIVVVNALLGLITLAIYRFWGKTRVRRYLWSRTRLLGDPFEYTGTGLELFKGFLIVGFLVLLPLFAVDSATSYLLQMQEPLLYGLFTAASYIVVLFLIGVATYRARRYRLTRTTWRGIRGAQTGSAMHYALKSLGFMLLLVLSLGFTYPWQRLNLMRHMMNETWFGDRRFCLEGGVRALYKPFLVLWLVYAAALALAIVVGIQVAGISIADVKTMFGAEDPAAQVDAVKRSLIFVGVFYPILVVVGGLGMAWYKAREYRYLATCVRYEDMRFTFHATFGGILWLAIGNLLVVALTLGLGAAFARMRTLRFACKRLALIGQVDVEAIRQSSLRVPHSGEGLADAFDVGGF